MAQPNTNIEKARKRGKDILDRRASDRTELTPDQQGGRIQLRGQIKEIWKRAPGGVEKEGKIPGGEAAPARTHLERRVVEPADVDILRGPETCGDCHFST